VRYQEGTEGEADLSHLAGRGGFEGQRLADLHHCTSWHRPGLTGHGQAACHAGQDLDYLLRLQRGFKAKTMTPATQPITDTEIVNLVHFMASLAAAP
jgi:hypothetical protein